MPKQKDQVQFLNTVAERLRETLDCRTDIFARSGGKAPWMIVQINGASVTCRFIEGRYHVVADFGDYQSGAEIARSATLDASLELDSFVNALSKICMEAATHMSTLRKRAFATDTAMRISASNLIAASGNRLKANRQTPDLWFKDKDIGAEFSVEPSRQGKVIITIVAPAQHAVALIKQMFATNKENLP
jgi:hypothetical protein